MASSKSTDDTVPVPENVLQLSRRRPSVVICNHRPEQRHAENAEYPQARALRGHHTRGHGELISNDFEKFLHCLTAPIMAVILYQHYRPETYTVVVNLEPVICWTTDGLPRLEFDKPQNWNHCPNMWGGFVLAVAQVKDLGPTPVIADPDCRHFIEFVTQKGVPSTFYLPNPKPALRLPRHSKGSLVEEKWGKPYLQLGN